MKKYISLLAGIMLSITSLMMIAPPAQAAGCSTQAQYNQIRNGMSLVRVQQIMRAPGYIVDSGYVRPVAWQLREWQKCAGGVFDYNVGFLRGPANVTGHIGWYVTLQNRATQPAQRMSPRSNAISMAYDYIDTMAFSKYGLADQLEYEGFRPAVALYAVNNIRVNWRTQAVRMARDYLDTMPFSCTGLIDQLEYEQFSYANAYYGAHHTNAC